MNARYSSCLPRTVELGGRDTLIYDVVATCIFTVYCCPTVDATLLCGLNCICFRRQQPIRLEGSNVAMWGTRGRRYWFTRIDLCKILR